MGRLRHSTSGHELLLLPEHVVGRSATSDLRLDLPRVSGQHAVLRWTGLCWEVRDLGSRNGTFVGGAKLVPGQATPLEQGDGLRFGDPSQEWTLIDKSPPGALIFPETGTEPLTNSGGVLAIPSSEDPQAMVYTDAQGLWYLERPEEPVVVLVNDQLFQAGGRSWRFKCPELPVRTAAMDMAHEMRALQLRFAVSRDEEHVEVKAEGWGQTYDLGSRSHHYLLLTLARERLQDISNGIPDGGSGWMYQDDLLDALNVPATHLNIEVFRIRKQFETLDVVDPANVIERRPRMKQLRLGVSKIVVETI